MVNDVNDEQHYIQRSLNKSNVEFESTQRKDALKSKYCQENNINYLVIHYKDKNRVEYVIEKFVLDCDELQKQLWYPYASYF